MNVAGSLTVTANATPGSTGTLNLGSGSLTGTLLEDEQREQAIHAMALRNAAARLDEIP